MKLGKVIISPDLRQLFLFPERDGNPHTVLQQAFPFTETGDIIQIDQNSPAHQ